MKQIYTVSIVDHVLYKEKLNTLLASYVKQTIHVIITTKSKSNHWNHNNNHDEIQMKSQWHHNDITMTLHWKHNENTQWKPNENTMKTFCEKREHNENIMWNNENIMWKTNEK